MCDKCSLALMGELGSITLHVLDLLLKTLYQILQAGCCFFVVFLLQKIEDLKETTCVSQNLAHFPSCLLERSDHFLVTEFFCCLFVSEHGRVHQALYCTAADCKGNLIIGFMSTVYSAPSL